MLTAAELARLPGLRSHLIEVATVIANTAEQLARDAHAPWMPAKGNRGRTMIVDADGDEIRVVNVDHAGHLYEWGSSNGPAVAPLRRAVRAAGLRLVQAPK